MRELPIDAPARVAKVRELPIDAPAGVAAHVCQLSIHGLPRAFTRAPPRTDPRAQAPYPPACGLGVEPIRVSHQPLRDALALSDKPEMPGVEIALVHGPVGGLCDRVRVARRCPPEVREQPIGVVDRLDPRPPFVLVRSSQQHREAARERLDVVGAISEARPDHVSDG